MDIFSSFFNMKVYCVFSLESPQRGDSNVYTQCTIFIIKREITPDYPKSAAKKLVKDIKPPSNLLLLRSYVILLLWSLSVTC